MSQRMIGTKKRITNELEIFIGLPHQLRLINNNNRRRKKERKEEDLMKEN